MKTRLNLEIGNVSDVGRVREHNEDSFACLQPSGRRQTQRRGHLLVVCDGMGGAVGGKTASSIAAETIPAVYYGGNQSSPSAALAEALHEANHRIYKRSQENPELAGMGTTTVALALVQGKAHIAHVGDSRCYFVRDGAIKQITEDHSIVQRMVKDGLLTPEQARNHPEGHILSRSIGVAPSVDVDLQEPLELRAGDTLILCSDGLSGQVEASEILEAVSSAAPQEAAGKLVELAKERGGPDNITVQVVRAVQGRPERSSSTLITATIRTKALRPRRRLRTLVIWLLILLLLGAVAVAALWFYEVVDFRTLLKLDWIPLPPKSFPPLK
jgi:serine/threonine protein phosphatase PrpC